MFIPFAVHHGRLDLTNWFQIVQVGDHFLGSGLAIVQSSHLSLNDAFSIFFCRVGQLHKLFLRLAAPNCICKYGMVGQEPFVWHEPIVWPLGSSWLLLLERVLC